MIVHFLSKVALLGATWVLYLLIALSFISLAAVAERLLFFRRNGRGGASLRQRLLEAFASNDLAIVESTLRGSLTVEARVLTAALAWRHGGPDVVAQVVDSELTQERPLLERGTTLLGTIGNNAPFIGLFGTVIGVIEAFHHLGAGGSNDAAMTNVMAGIAEALIATGVGIFVAIPAVVAFNVIQKRIERVEQETLALGKLLGAWLSTRREASPVVLRSQDQLAVAPSGGHPALAAVRE